MISFFTVYHEGMIPPSQENARFFFMHTVHANLAFQACVSFF